MNDDYSENREPLDTKSMLEEGFFNRLGKNLKPLPKENKQVISEAKTNYNTEKLLLNLFEARDGLIENYSKLGINSYSQNVVDSINKIGSCICSLGGEVEKFDPFVHISGLQAPNLIKNAKRVIENTMDSYSLGKIEDAKINKDGKEITITFTGQQNNIDYKAVGTLVASKAWVGNEAVDYIYSPNEGRMSVKVFSDEGKWVDKSSNYKISWELFENEANLNVMASEGENKIKEGKAENNIENIKEVKNTTKNNTEENIGDDFPVEEKHEN